MNSQLVSAARDFYGLVLLQKFGLALGLFLVGIALEWSGFKETMQASTKQLQR